MGSRIGADPFGVRQAGRYVMFPQTPSGMPVRNDGVVQVKYTNPHDLPDHALFFRPPATDITGIRMKERESIRKERKIEIKKKKKKKKKGKKKKKKKKKK